MRLLDQERNSKRTEFNRSSRDYDVCCMSILVITPTYNEVKNIEKFIESIQKINLDLLIIDDNSPDGTASVVKKFSSNFSSINLIIRDKKLGLGSAYREGFKWAENNNYKYIVEMDADFSHQFSDLQNLLDQRRPNRLVIGSRYIPGGKVIGWSLYRKTLSKYANLFSRILKQSNVKDMTSGFRVYSMNALKKSNYLKSNSDGYAFQIEMVVKCLNSDVEVVEVPITFVERELGRSKMNYIIIIEAIKYLFKKI
jgi:dolichol-phosphate mannosyltransferase